MVQGAFFMKAIVVLLSSFKEVLMLDADQVPVADPTPLFKDRGFVESGALLWPDFWAATWAPDAPNIIGVSEEEMPTRSFESGQMLFDKSRCVQVPRVANPASSMRSRLPHVWAPDPLHQHLSCICFSAYDVDEVIVTGGFRAFRMAHGWCDSRGWCAGRGRR